MHGHGSIGHQWYAIKEGAKIIFLPKSRDIYPLYLMIGRYAKINWRRYLRLAVLGRVESAEWSPNISLSSLVIKHSPNLAKRSITRAYDIEKEIEAIKSLHGSSIAYSSFDKLLPLMQCTKCRQGGLGLGRDLMQFHCEHCGAIFPIINGIPIFTEHV
jgi:uncharacterized protein YbaR (Trm112 family)